MKSMSIASDMADFTFTSRFARYIAEKQRRETWEEAVYRVRDMHLEKYRGKGVDADIIWAFEQVKAKRVLGSQRALQFGGPAILKKNARMYNCTASYCDRLRFFQEAFWLLLCGSGVGFSVQKHHIAQLPHLIRQKPHASETFVVPDTIEGWADAAGRLIYSYHEDTEHTGKLVEFDYSRIRAKGSPISAGGAAPGPMPLYNALEKIRGLLDHCVDEHFIRLLPIHAYDITMHESDAVLAGGVRRSATTALFSKDDQLMASAKTGDWFEKNPQRGRSNNSALLVRNQLSFDEFEAIMKNTRECGEPGFCFASSPEDLFNPCYEIGMRPRLPEIYTPRQDLAGKSGFQGCNLVEQNASKFETEDDYALAAKAATIIATLQAGYTDLEYLGEVSEHIFKREALLGVSMTGIMEKPEIALNPSLQRKMAALVIETNKWMAAKIGINQAARTTCVKPAGTTTIVLEIESMASGHHSAHADKILRRMQTNKWDPVYMAFKKMNPDLCEESVWSANKTDDVISWPLQAPAGTKVKADFSATEFLDAVRSTQINWVNAGTAIPEASPGLTHNVSNTCVVRPDEWDKITRYIFDNRWFFTGVSLVPDTGDKIYAQAPFEAMTTPEELTRWEALRKVFNPVDYTQVLEEQDNTNPIQEIACSGGACTIAV